MIKVLSYNDIDQTIWQSLVERSSYATWFQTPEAYKFYASVPEEIKPFAVGVSEDDQLLGVVVGYTTQEKNFWKQMLTVRSIIVGGPLLAEDISDDALTALLNAIKKYRVKIVEIKDEINSQAYTPYTIHHTPIYIESRNFHDYSRWRSTFEKCGFAYQPHLNFHVDATSVEVMEKNIGKSRKRDIKTTIRDGVVPIMQPTIEQVKEYFGILQQLYTTKVKTPLFSWKFFEQLYYTEYGHFFLTKYQGKIIGGTVCVELPNKALYEWFVCGEDGVYDHIFPSSYATYLGIKYAAEHNCKIFDMMGAGKPEKNYGVRDFKARFGGKLVEHGRYLCVRKSLLYLIGKLGVKLLKKK